MLQIMPDEAEAYLERYQPIPPARRKIQSNAQHRNQHHIHQRPGRDAPKHGARTARRIYERDAAERPQNDLIGRAARLPARQGVAEFVEQNDAQKREVFVKPQRSAS